jgi:peptidoglycan/LPS O-acetylase OafA/YrhL
MINEEKLIRVLAFGGGYGMLLLAVLNQEKQQRTAGRQWSNRDWMVLCGDASYSIYLCHPFVLAILGTLFVHLHLHLHLHLSMTMNWVTVVLRAGCILGLG